MLRNTPVVLLIGFSVAALSCANNTVVQTGSVNVEVNPDADFTQYETFSVVTTDLVDPPELDVEQDEQVAFNDMVNGLIIEAMQKEPVCLTFIPPDAVTDEIEPDVWAANGLGRATDGGYYYQCRGGWWWGYWGWYWDPCAIWYPTYVEYDVGSLLVMVGPPPAAPDEEPVPAFSGLAQSILATGADSKTKIQSAIQMIFAQWPDPRTCPSTN